ncbi:MAG: alpha/beta hydrolase-fold protein [Steroidobacteraceae bacterium]
MRKPNWPAAALLWILSALLCSVAAAASTPRFEVTFPRQLERGPITGRLIVVIAKQLEPEPRLLLDLLRSPAAFGVDIEAVRAGTAMVVDSNAAGYPLHDLGELPRGDYYVQALLIRYTHVRRSDEHELWVPLSPTGLIAARFPGNLHSKVQKLTLDPAQQFVVPIELSEAIAPYSEEPDTQWLKTVRIKSEILSKFWGTPIYFGARVLLPRGFDDHPQSRYPGIYVFGHGTPFFFDTDPATNTERAIARARSANLQTGYDFYQTWIRDDFPRVVGICPIIPSPYNAESYAVNSANNGPWGDAITRELMPYLERKFRLIARPHARIVEGASTGGWEALAMQLYYPDLIGGAWVFNPDPIDFSRYQLNDIYSDENMFSVPTSAWTRTERPMKRSNEGQVLWTMRQIAQFEAMLGSRGRSHYQFDIWQATYGPAGADGYPVLLFDKKTGAIDKNVVAYMREHGYDLTEYTRRNWATLGPKLNGKLNFFAGEQDDFFLNLGVYNFQDMLHERHDPPAVARFEYGRPKKGHNWHLTDFSEMVREMAAHIRRTAPAGEDAQEWNY